MTIVYLGKLQQNHYIVNLAEIAILSSAVYFLIQCTVPIAEKKQMATSVQQAAMRKGNKE